MSVVGRYTKKIDIHITQTWIRILWMYKKINNRHIPNNISSNIQNVRQMFGGHRQTSTQKVILGGGKPVERQLLTNFRAWSSNLPFMVPGGPAPWKSNLPFMVQGGSRTMKIKSPVHGAGGVPHHENQSATVPQHATPFIIHMSVVGRYTKKIDIHITQTWIRILWMYKKINNRHIPNNISSNIQNVRRASTDVDPKSYSELEDHARKHRPVPNGSVITEIQLKRN